MQPQTKRTEDYVHFLFSNWMSSLPSHSCLTPRLMDQVSGRSAQDRVWLVQHRGQRSDLKPTTKRLALVTLQRIEPTNRLILTDTPIHSLSTFNILKIIDNTMGIHSRQLDFLCQNWWRREILWKLRLWIPICNWESNYVSSTFTTAALIRKKLLESKHMLRFKFITNISSLTWNVFSALGSPHTYLADIHFSVCQWARQILL